MKNEVAQNEVTQNEVLQRDKIEQQGIQSTYDTANKYATLASRSIFIINGGACIALLSLSGSVIKSDYVFPFQAFLSIGL